MKSVCISRLHELFAIDQMSGIIKWKVSPSTHVQAGDIAGCDCSNGYRRIRFDGISMSAHRIIYAMIHGDFPEQVDHIDGNRSNNAISNLRAASHAQNMQNSKLKKSNTSGVKCVTWNSKLSKWQVQCRADGKRFYLGLFASKTEAANVADKFRIENHGEFARHG